MKRKTIVIVLAVLLAGLGAALVAQTAHRKQMGHWHRGPGGLLQHITRTFALTDAQQTQVKAMWESEKPNVMPLLQQLSQQHKEMIAATAKGTFDEGKVTSIADQESQTIGKLLVQKEKLQSKFYQILTPEQRVKFDTLQQRREAHMENMLQKLATDNPTK